MITAEDQKAAVKLTELSQATEPIIANSPNDATKYNKLSLNICTKFKHGHQPNNRIETPARDTVRDTARDTVTDINNMFKVFQKEHHLNNNDDLEMVPSAVLSPKNI